MSTQKVSGGRINIVEVRQENVHKVYRHGGVVKGLGLSAQQRYKNEVTALSIYEGGGFAPLHVPKIISTDEHALTLIMERIPAESMETTVRRNILFLTRERAIKLAHTLRQIHAYRTSTDPQLYTAYLSSFSGFVHNASAILQEANIDPRQLTAWMRQSLSGLQLHQEVTSIHGDFWFENILANDSNFHVIDWEFYATGSPYQDLGAFYTNTHEHFPESRNFCDAFFTAYATRIDMNLVQAFSIYRCLWILSHIELKDYEQESVERPHSFKELIHIVSKHIS